MSFAASLVEAAVRAAVRAKAPRLTVAAAAAVAVCAFSRAALRPGATQAEVVHLQPQGLGSPCDDDLASDAPLVVALRARRKRRRKAKAERRAACRSGTAAAAEP